MKALEVKNLKVRYRTIVPFAKAKRLLGIKQTTPYQVEAVKGISFSVEKGEIIGLIGSNGSGKTTLLRCLAGIFSPDEGTIDLFGNTVSLQAIGVGFQTTLSGYENIYLSGLLLGYSKEQIDEKIDDIIDFSELGDFIYMPVKSYSSGMHSKLAFSIIAVLETDILLIDEVFSVGDAAFKKKSGAKMREIISDGSKTVIIVSHSMEVIRKYCSKAIWLEKGELMSYGDVYDVVEQYEQYNQSRKPTKRKKTPVKRRSGRFGHRIRPKNIEEQIPEQSE